MTIARLAGQLSMVFAGDTCYACWFMRLEAEPSPCAMPNLGRRGRRLCGKHQARFDEGACVLCGRRLAWLPIASTPNFAFCRPCLVERRGEETVRIVEAMLELDWIKLLS